jgi:predicted dehydrogenase
VLKFSGNVLSRIAAGISVNQENIVRIFGTEGRIIVPAPWVDSYSVSEAGRIIIQRDDDIAPQEITIPATVTSFTYEADVFGDAVAAGRKEAPSPAMTWADSLGNMRTLDTWRARIGVKYEFE